MDMGNKQCHQDHSHRFECTTNESRCNPERSQTPIGVKQTIEYREVGVDREMNLLFDELPP